MLIRWGSKHIQLPKYRRWRDETALKIPPFGDLQRHEAVAAFLRMMRRLYHAGVSPIQAWEGAMNTSKIVDPASLGMPRSLAFRRIEHFVGRHGL